MSNLDKNRKISSTISANRIRRRDMIIKVFECKIDESHLNKKKLKLIEDCFIQAKWIYNNLISNQSIFDFNSKIQDINVTIFNNETQKCDKIENRKLTIGSQIKQAIVERTIQNIINLSKAKEKGIKVGKLKFKKEVTSIPLKQFGVTYKIKGKNIISIQGVGKLRVNGIEQTKDAEFANAVLIKKSSGYFIKLTCYKYKEDIMTKDSIGLDFGIKDSIVTSNGDKYNYNFEIPNELKRKQRKLSKKQKGSNNYNKQCSKIKKSYENLTNKKNDAANKFVNKLKQYENIIIQDENIKGWHADLFGKQVQQSILGRIKSKVKTLGTSTVINRWLPTTKISPMNGKIIDIKLNERKFNDGNFSEDRDIKSAKTILCLGLYNPKLTRKELMSLPVEELASVFSNYKFENNKLNPMNQEATRL